MWRVLLLVLALVSVGDASASDSPPGRWLPPTIGFAPYKSGNASVVVGGNGVAVAVYGSDMNGLTAATRLPGGAWDRVPLSSEPLGEDVAVDGAGNALVTAWHWEGPNDDLVKRIVAFTRAAGSRTWSGPVAVSDAEPWFGSGPVLAVNGRGQAVTVWNGYDGELPVLRAAVRGADGAWSPPENIGVAGPPPFARPPPSVAIDAHGDAVAVWADSSYSAANVYATFRTAGRDWEPPVVLSDRADGMLHVRVTMNRRGDALAVWGDRDPSGKVDLVSSVRAAGAMNWTEPIRIPVSEPDEPLGAEDGLSFALDEMGNATLVAQTGGGQVEAATRTAGNPGWEGPMVLGDGGDRASYTVFDRDFVCVEPRIAIDARGGVVVIWGGAALYAVRREAGSRTWEKPVTVAPGPVCFGRTLGVDPSGDAVAIWNDKQWDVAELNAAVLDATPPLLERLAVPTSARVHRQIRFSVAASDVWSRLARPPLWQFGDGGASVRGGAVRHLYRRPGRYLVRVSAEDVAGNVATSTARILVRGRR